MGDAVVTLGGGISEDHCLLLSDQNAITVNKIFVNYYYNVKHLIKLFTCKILVNFAGDSSQIYFKLVPRQTILGMKGVRMIGWCHLDKPRHVCRASAILFLKNNFNFIFIIELK